RQRGRATRLLVINPQPGSVEVIEAASRDSAYLSANDPAAVADSVLKHVSRLNDPLGELGAAAQTRWYGQAGLGSRRFVGRLAELWKLHAQLTGTLYPMTTNAVGPSVALVSGLAGIAHTLLA